MSDTPDFKSAAYIEQRPYWDMVEDVLTGTPAIRRAGELYTPRAKAESEERYKARLNRSRFFNIYARVLDSLVGRVYRKPPKLANDAGAGILQDVENIDGRGTHLAVLGRRLFRQSIHQGFSAILIDTPQVQLDRRPTLADATRLGLRPYWVPIKASQIWNHRPTVVNGREVLSQVTIYEEPTEPVGRFGETTAEQWRVFSLDGSDVVWEVWRRNQKGTPEIQRGGVFQGLGILPVVPGYSTEPLGWFHARPMLYEVAEQNLDHYAVQSDHRYSLHVSSTPVPVLKDEPLIGEDGTPTPLSVEDGIRLYSAHGDAFFMEHKGSALGETRLELQELEDRCLYLGLQTTVRRTRAAETAEAKRMDGIEQDSVIAVAARGHQDALEQALTIHARLRGEESASVTMSYDYDGLSMTPEMYRAVVESWGSGIISRETAWQMLEAGGVLPEDFDRELERRRLEQEAMEIRPDNNGGAGDGDPSRFVWRRGDLRSREAA